MNVSFSIILVLSQAPHPLLTTDQPQSTNEQECLQGYLDIFPSCTFNNIQCT